MKGSVEHLTLFSLGCTNTHTHVLAPTDTHSFPASCATWSVFCVWCILTLELERLPLPLCLSLSDVLSLLGCVRLCVLFAWRWKKTVTGFPPFVGLWLLSSEVQTGLLKCHSREGPLRLSDKWSLTLCGCEGAAGSSCGDAELRQMQGLRTKGTCAKGEISL